MCHRLWLGGEPLYTDKGLYPRTKNRSISTPNTGKDKIKVRCISKVAKTYSQQGEGGIGFKDMNAFDNALLAK
ncbi:Uncharacterized protein TCM_036706 [Theobroma cacao]|uniref:Uncharacterized protein n=1 Tax=Theobroma cacao TaxID=3641 RepID=A0A061FK93_THECC|nr:Uncharacterized protein TCM_036706 [Theobroma cacao]